MEAASQFIISESNKNQDSIEIYFISRNFWNFFKLNYYDEKLFNILCEDLKQKKKEEINSMLDK